MRNQIAAAERGGIRTRADHERQPGRVGGDHRRAASDDELDVLLVAPERFANAAFRARRAAARHRTGRAARDRRGALHQRLGPRLPPRLPAHRARASTCSRPACPVLCTTATANDRVVHDIVDQLGGDLLVLRGSLDRESLALDVLHLPSQAERLAWLAQRLPELPGTGIVYTLDRRGRAPRRGRGCDPTASQRARTPATRPPRTASRSRRSCWRTSSSASSRPRRSAWATTSPTSRSSCTSRCPVPRSRSYQQIGRAGPGHRPRLRDRARRRRRRAHPELVHRHRVPVARARRRGHRSSSATDDWVKLAAARSDREPAAHAPARGAEDPRGRRRGRGRRLEVAAHVAAVGVPGRPRGGGDRPTARRAGAHARVPRHRRLPDAVPAPRARREGRAAVRPVRALCSARISSPTTSTRRIVAAAVRFLQDQSYAIEPRAAPGMRAPEGRAQPNPDARSRSTPTAAGARLVRDDKKAGAFSDTLVDALVELADGAAFEPAPEWVTCVPSWRTTELVPSLAERVASAARAAVPSRRPAGARDGSRRS